MPIRTFLDLPRNEAGLVERFIGSAYDTVKVVSDNLEAVLAVPTDLETMQGLEDNVNNIFDSAKALIAEQVAAASSSAADADKSVQAASVSAQEALSSKQTAEAFLKAASGVAQTYPDTTQGLAGTTDGQYFNVSGSGDVYSYSYLNKGGNAVLQSTMPSYAYTQSLDTNKVNRSGDTITGDLSVTGDTSLNKLTVNSVSEITSPSKQLIVDTHADDDGYRQYFSKDGGKTSKLISLYNGDYNLYSDTGYATINSNKLVDFAHMGSGSGVDADTVDGKHAADFASFADKVNLQAAIDTKFDKAGGDITYGGNKASFQSDGSFALYGADNTVNTTIKDGAVWAAGIISSDNNINATGMLHVQSLNGQNGLDIHSDDDGIVRMFAKNANVDWQSFLTSNPQGNLDLNSPKGELYFNSQKVAHMGNMGSGSGFDADLIRGLDPVTLCGSGDVQHGLNGWTRLPNNRIDMWFAGDWLKDGSGEMMYTFNFPRAITQTDMVSVCIQLKPKFAIDQSNLDKTDTQYQIMSWTNSSVTVFKQISGYDWNFSRPLFTVKGIF